MTGTSISVTPGTIGTVTYTLTAVNASGSAGAQVAVNVAAAPTLQWKRTSVYGFGTLLSEESSTGTTYIQTDQVGSPNIVTDSAGIVVGRSKNLPYGERFGSIGEKSARRYTNHEDNEGPPQSPIYMQARVYLPAYGRFAQVDPAYDQAKDDPESWNLYSYVTNNPVTKTDPDGRIAFGEDLRALQGATIQPYGADWGNAGFTGQGAAADGGNWTKYRTAIELVAPATMASGLQTIAHCQSAAGKRTNEDGPGITDSDLAIRINNYLNNSTILQQWFTLAGLSVVDFYAVDPVSAKPPVGEGRTHLSTVVDGNSGKPIGYEVTRIVIATQKLGNPKDKIFDERLAEKVAHETWHAVQAVIQLKNGIVKISGFDYNYEQFKRLHDRENMFVSRMMIKEYQQLPHEKEAFHQAELVVNQLKMKGLF